MGSQGWPFRSCDIKDTGGPRPVQLLEEGPIWMFGQQFGAAVGVEAWRDHLETHTSVFASFFFF